jgi:hypothetical protein
MLKMALRSNAPAPKRDYFTESHLRATIFQPSGNFVRTAVSPTSVSIILSLRLLTMRSLETIRA